MTKLTGECGRRIGGKWSGVDGVHRERLMIGVTGPPGLYGSKREQTNIIKVESKRKKSGENTEKDYFLFIVWSLSKHW